MARFDFGTSRLAVREDLCQAYRQAWIDVARPGTWWSGAERVAIARESRAALGCAFCRERKAALSPYALDGTHAAEADDASVLDAQTIDAVHRVVTDASRITRRLVDDYVETGRSVEHYVELLGVVVLVLCVDEFHRALGLPLEPLPDPEPGSPTRRRIADDRLDRDLAFVPVLKTASATGDEADLWPTDQGHISNVMRALSLVPNALREYQAVSAAQYVPMLQVANVSNNAGRSISRPQMELVAARVTDYNECFY